MGILDHKSFKKRYLWIIVVFLILYGLGVAFFWLNHFYFFALLPIGIVLLYLVFYKPKLVFYLIVFFTPLSFILKDYAYGFSVNLPTEPFTFLLSVILVFKVLSKGIPIKKAIYHPLTIVIIANLLWILITSLFSSMPIVSLKFFLSRAWYVGVFYFLAIYFFKDPKEVKRFIWLYVSSMAIVILYSTYKHSLSYFTRFGANVASLPFFKDHTIYGMIIAFFTPILIIFVLYNKRVKISFKEHVWSFLILILFLLGLILSYSRAAWLSVSFAVAFYFICLLKIRFRTLALTLMLFVGIVYVFQNDIILFFRENKATHNTDLEENLQSVSNITTDESNTERLNRWASAIRMFKERPVLGWGPGTYMFQYAPFQLSYEKTGISTITGNLGNAHSEYLGPLSESGLLGLLTFVFIVIFAIYFGMKNFYSKRSDMVRFLSLGVLLSLITYFTHGLMNNFLDSDKASVAFWAFLAMITTFNVYFKKHEGPDREKAVEDFHS